MRHTHQQDDQEKGAMTTKGNSFVKGREESVSKDVGWDFKSELSLKEWKKKKRSRQTENRRTFQSEGGTAYTKAQSRTAASFAEQGMISSSELPRDLRRRETKQELKAEDGSGLELVNVILSTIKIFLKLQSRGQIEEISYVNEGSWTWLPSNEDPGQGFPREWHVRVWF